MRPKVLSALLALPLALSTTWAEGRSGGIAGGGCVGCHDEGAVDISLQATPASFSPGEQVSMQLSVGAPGQNVAGVYVDCEAQGTLETLSGEGLAEVSEGLVHTAPRPFSGGNATFNFNWIAPSTPGALRCIVHALAGDGNGRSNGDAASEAFFDFVYGCEPTTYYRDSDGDGSGVTSATRTACVDIAPQGYSLLPGDCNDNHQDVHPDAVELCNNRDDNCNGEIDEDSVPVEQYPDGDGDGYYSNEEFLSGDVFVGCLTPGYAAEPGDCRPNDPAIFPGAEEVCNLLDDNCDGRVDLRVRPQCGEGRCRRDSGTCEPETCIPGAPQPETCNLLDDDCDGIVDNGNLCEPGLECIAGRCRVPDATTPTAGSEGSSESVVVTSAGGSGGTQATGTTNAVPDASGSPGGTTSSAQTTSSAPAAAAGNSGGSCSLHPNGSPAPLLVWMLPGLLALGRRAGGKQHARATTRKLTSLLALPVLRS